jgi:hypothetical protein
MKKLKDQQGIEDHRITTQKENASIVVTWEEMPMSKTIYRLIVMRTAIFRLT